MAPRIVLHTGKGGAGTTTVAAATAHHAAAAGHRVLLLSSEPALGEVLDAEVGDAPAPVADGLWARRIGHAPQAEPDADADPLGGWLAERLADGGAGPVPGLGELLALLALRRHADDTAFDVVVADCLPAGDPLRLLALPDAARRLLDRLVAALEGRAAGTRPFARAVLDVALPGGDALAGLVAAGGELLETGDVLRDAERTSIRLVTTPGRIAAAAARRTWTALGLYGLPVDAVVVNRARADRDALEDAFAPAPVLRAPELDEEPLGPRALARLGAAAFGDRDAAAVLHRAPAERLELAEDSARLHLPLPLAQRGEVSLRQVGGELVVRVHEHTRTLQLPAALHGWSARGAALADGALTVDLEAPVA